MSRGIGYRGRHVLPASEVEKPRPSWVRITADWASWASTEIQSGGWKFCSAGLGDGTICHVSPSVERRIVPLRPTIQQTVSDGAEPASRSACTGLDSGVQVLPPSVERSMWPRGPKRQTICGFVAATTRSPGRKPRAFARMYCALLDALLAIIPAIAPPVTGAAELCSAPPGAAVPGAALDVAFAAAAESLGAGSGAGICAGATMTVCSADSEFAACAC